MALLGLFVFPAAVATASLRNQLFDIRLAARSSAAYGAVTLGITGLFALTISFADALFAPLQRGRPHAGLLDRRSSSSRS